MMGQQGPIVLPLFGKEVKYVFFLFPFFHDLYGCVLPGATVFMFKLRVKDFLVRVP